MGKMTDREKQAHYRQKIAKEYKDRLDDLRDKNLALEERNVKLERENNTLVKRNNELEKENEEMKKHLNLSDSEVRILIEAAKTERHLNEVFSTFMGRSY